MFPEGIETRRPISKMTKVPRPVCQGCYHISISLSHLEDQGEKTNSNKTQVALNINWKRLDTNCQLKFTGLPQSFSPFPPDLFITLLESCIQSCTVVFLKIELISNCSYVRNKKFKKCWSKTIRQCNKINDKQPLQQELGNSFKKSLHLHQNMVFICQLSCTQITGHVPTVRATHFQNGRNRCRFVKCTSNEHRAI